MYDPRDPTTALFLSEGAASRAAEVARRNHPDRVRETKIKMRRRRGENLGYEVLVFFRDNRPPSPLTNSDVERLFGPALN